MIDIDPDPFVFGQVLLVRVPYIEGKTPKVKVRPAVVVSREAVNATGSCIVLGISSQPVSKRYERAIRFWREAGLTRPSKVWISRPYPVQTHDVVKILGALQAEDLLAIYREFIATF